MCIVSFLSSIYLRHLKKITESVKMAAAMGRPGRLRHRLRGKLQFLLSVTFAFRSCSVFYGPFVTFVFSVSARHESGEDTVRLDFDRGERLFQTSSASSSVFKVIVPVIQVMHKE